MNRLILGILIILFPLEMAGQMFTLSDNYGYNTLSINPAYAGCQDALSATILYRNQWVGFKDAPTSYLMSVHMPFLNDKIGMGLLMEKNSIGIFRETNIIGNYAYRIKLNKGILSLGLGFGVTVNNIAWNKLVATDPNDIQLMDNPPSAILPVISLGAYYYAQKYYFGFSIPGFLTHTLDQTTGKYKTSNNFSEYNYIFMGGYALRLNSGISMLPSLLIKYYPRNGVQVDYNLQVRLKDKFWVGIGYRNKNSLTGMVQMQLNYQLRVVYSYGFDLGSLAKYKNGSHEIGLNYILRYSRKVNGPRQF